MKLYVVLNEEKEARGMLPSHGFEAEIFFSFPLSLAVSITFIFFSLSNFQICLHRKTIPPLAPSQVSELSARYSQGALLKEGFGIEMIGAGTLKEGGKR